MTKQKTGRSVGRPEDPRKAAAIVEAGWALFVERGVKSVSMEAVASKAGVSKATLYKHISDKAVLFEAGVRREMELIEASQQRDQPSPENLAITEVLRQFGLGILSFIVSDPAIAFYNALAGDLSRYPDLARRFYDLGPGRTRANLTAILMAAAERGELAISDPAEAAEHLFGLWQGFSNFQLSLGIDVQAIRSGLPVRVERAVAVFMRAYEPG